jgi:ATP-binding protein involved in chromosome partitioning
LSELAENSRMADVTEAEVLERLRRVPGPDGAGDLVSLGMIGGLAVKGGHVTFAIQVDPKQGPKLESLRQAAEKAVDAVPGVLSVTAVLTA